MLTMPSSIKDLPEYSYGHPVCPKCTGREAIAYYGSRVTVDIIQVEWIQRECTNCGFEWCEKCADWKKNA